MSVRRHRLRAATAVVAVGRYLLTPLTDESGAARLNAPLLNRDDEP